jgi:predicted DNA-binding transcriptional regulator AlpA
MELMTLKEVAAYFDCHFKTIINWTSEARDGKNTFPLPVSMPGKKQKWLRSEIENWSVPLRTRPESPVERAVRGATTKQRLARHGLVAK